MSHRRIFLIRSTGFALLLAGLAVWCSLGGCCSVDRHDRNLDALNPENGGGTSTTPELKDADVDLESRPLTSIPPGTIIGKSAPEGWSQLILIATPTFSKEAMAQAPPIAAFYAQLLKFTLLARAKKVGDTYKLDAVGCGFAVDIDGKETIISSKKTMGANLRAFGRTILDENEKVIEKDVRQVARTTTMLIFDAQATMRRGNDHVRMVNRHAVLVEPDSGKITTFVWLLAKNKEEYTLADGAMQLLPDNFREPRMLAVKREKFNILGMPTPDAFALVRIPQGKSVTSTDELTKLAAWKDFKRNQVPGLEKSLRELARRAMADRK